VNESELLPAYAAIHRQSGVRTRRNWGRQLVRCRNQGLWDVGDKRFPIVAVGDRLCQFAQNHIVANEVAANSFRVAPPSGARDGNE